jgi:hypothetical protein
MPQSKQAQPDQSKPNQSKPEQSILAFTWYREHGYDTLIEVSRNQEGLKPSYEEWLDDAERAFAKYQNMGLEPTRVHLDVDAYLAWCERRERPINQKSREMFKEIKRQEFYRNLED